MAFVRMSRYVTGTALLTATMLSDSACGAAVVRLHDQDRSLPR
jgi:hypothetical protein